MIYMCSHNPTAGRNFWDVLKVLHRENLRIFNIHNSRQCHYYHSISASLALNYAQRQRLIWGWHHLLHSLLSFSVLVTKSHHQKWGKNRTKRMPHYPFHQASINSYSPKSTGIDLLSVCSWWESVSPTRDRVREIVTLCQGVFSPMSGDEGNPATLSKEGESPSSKQHFITEWTPCGLSSPVRLKSRTGKMVKRYRQKWKDISNLVNFLSKSILLFVCLFGWLVVFFCHCWFFFLFVFLFSNGNVVLWKFQLLSPLLIEVLLKNQKHEMNIFSCHRAL